MKLNEYILEIPKDTETMNLKTPNEVYLEVYKKAREKAESVRRWRKMQRKSTRGY